MRLSQIRHVNPQSLTNHPLNGQLYETTTDDALVEAIRERGILQVLVATSRNVLLSGHRRWKAALGLGLKSVPVQVWDAPNEAIAIIEFNRHRHKTLGERMREGALLEAELAKDAAARQRAAGANGKQGGRGKSKTLPPKLAEGYSQKASARLRESASQVAKVLGLGRETYRKAKHVLTSSATPPELKEKLERESISPDRAYRQVRKLENVEERQARRAQAAAPTDRRQPRVMHGDCLDEMPKLSAASVDLILTDPPYAISSNKRTRMVGDRIENAVFGDWDVLKPDEYQQLLDRFLKQAARILKPGGSLYLFCDRLAVGQLWVMMLRHELVPKNILVWVKTNPVPNCRHNYSSATEFFLYALKPGAKPIWNELDAQAMTNAWIGPKCTSSTERTEHPTQKPLWLFEKVIRISSDPDGTVLDAFAGSGTAGEAAWKLGRRSVVIEKNEQYVAWMQQRFAAVEVE